MNIEKKKKEAKKLWDIDNDPNVDEDTRYDVEIDLVDLMGQYPEVKEYIEKLDNEREKQKHSDCVGRTNG